MNPSSKLTVLNHRFMMAAIMTSNYSCRLKTQRNFSIKKSESLTVGTSQKPRHTFLSHSKYLSQPKYLLVVSAFMTLLLTGCQSTPTNDLTGSTRYQTLTEPSNKRNVDKQEVARVRTSLAAQYIRKNELDTAQRQLEKAFAADSRYAPAYDMMGFCTTIATAFRH